MKFELKVLTHEAISDWDGINIIQMYDWLKKTIIKADEIKFNGETVYTLERLSDALSELVQELEDFKDKWAFTVLHKGKENEKLCVICSETDRPEFRITTIKDNEHMEIVELDITIKGKTQHIHKELFQAITDMVKPHMQKCEMNIKIQENKMEVRVVGDFIMKYMGS